jgi:hypothetical protein
MKHTHPKTLQKTLSAFVAIVFGLLIVQPAGAAPKDWKPRPPRKVSPGFYIERTDSQPLVVIPGSNVTFGVRVVPFGGYSGSPLVGPRSATPGFSLTVTPLSQFEFSVTVYADISIPPGVKGWGVSAADVGLWADLPLDFVVPNQTGTTISAKAPSFAPGGTTVGVNVTVSPEVAGVVVDGTIEVYDGVTGVRLLLPTPVKPAGESFSVLIPTPAGQGIQKVTALFRSPSGAVNYAQVTIALV